MEKEKALDRAHSYCARAERCIADLRRKFYDWQVPEELREELIEQMLSERYIDEERFALAYTRDKYRFNAWGEYRIRQELKLRGIPTAYIDRAWSELEEEFDAHTQLESLLEKKYRQTKAGQERRKTFDQLMRFALYRGYGYDDARPIIERLLGEEF